MERDLNPEPIASVAPVPAYPSPPVDVLDLNMLTLGLALPLAGLAAQCFAFANKLEALSSRYT